MSFELDELHDMPFELDEGDIDDIDKEIEDENTLSGMSGGLKFNRTFKGGLSG